jgi:osmotically-inducible protein OsmY
MGLAHGKWAIDADPRIWCLTPVKRLRDSFALGQCGLPVGLSACGPAAAVRPGVCKGDKAMDDKTLRQHIIDELDFEPSVNSANIGVAVENGVVTLSGHVASYAERVAVERAVRRVHGVRAIAAELEVRYPYGQPVSDDQIAERALQVIAWDARIPEGALSVRVEKGWVTLEGAVGWQYQKSACESAVRKLTGVVGVSNFIGVKPRLQASDVHGIIMAALKRNAEVEADAIRVIVSGDKVTLEGKVNALFERDLVEQAAWSAPGVASVVDRLTIA